MFSYCKTSQSFHFLIFVCISSWVVFSVSYIKKKFNFEHYGKLCAILAFQRPVGPCQFRAHPVRMFSGSVRTFTFKKVLFYNSILNRLLNLKYTLKIIPC